VNITITMPHFQWCWIQGTSQYIIESSWCRKNSWKMARH